MESTTPSLVSAVCAAGSGEKRRLRMHRGANAITGPMGVSSLGMEAAELVSGKRIGVPSQTLGKLLGWLSEAFPVPR